MRRRLHIAEFFDSVKVSIPVNIFFDGKVQSRTLVFPDGSRKTLGVYLPGDYEFHSDGPEKVLMTKGSVEVLFPQDSDWRRINKGEVYMVPQNTKFKVRCSEISEYICDFL